MKLRIFDTGYYSTTDLSSQETNANRAGYDGISTVVWFDLDVTSIKRNAGANTDNSPTPGNYSNPDINFVSFEGTTYMIECSMAKNYSPASTFQYNFWIQLARLEKTKGLKVIYPSSASDTYKTSIEQFGEYNASNGVFQGSGKPLPAGTPYISGRVHKISGFSDDSKSKRFKFTIEFRCEEEVPA